MYKTSTFSKLKVFTAALSAGIILSGISAPVFAAKPDWANKSEATIVQTAVGLSGVPFTYDANGQDFDILVAAVVTTGYDLDPLNGEEDYTVFAPVDDAFTAVADALNGEDPLVDLNGNGSVEDEAVDILVGALGAGGIRDVLDYHVTDGVRISRSVTTASKLTMLDGNTITARQGFIEAIGSDADLLLLDLRVADGIIHVIDTVLLPF